MSAEPKPTTNCATAASGLEDSSVMGRLGVTWCELLFNALCIMFQKITKQWLSQLCRLLGRSLLKSDVYLRGSAA